MTSSRCVQFEFNDISMHIKKDFEQRLFFQHKLLKTYILYNIFIFAEFVLRIGSNNNAVGTMWN